MDGLETRVPHYNYDIPGRISVEFEKVFTPSNILAGFRKTQSVLNYSQKFSHTVGNRPR